MMVRGQLYAPATLFLGKNLCANWAFWIREKSLPSAGI